MSHQAKITPTSNEYTLKPDDLIVTKTDIKGKITYANGCFLKLSVLEEKNTLNQPHSLIRHPDMPKAVFRLLWNTLDEGNEFFGIIKNLSSDGSFYWVFANITPSFDELGKTIGYFSVRRQANRKLVNIMSDLYRKMVQEEKRHKDDESAMKASTQLLTNFIDEQGVSYNEYLISFA